MTTCLMPRWLAPRLILLGMAFTAFAVHFGVAYAEGGEAGLVIQHGDGSVDTYCVGFQGSSISGPELLTKAGIAVVQFNGAVCAIGSQEGCFQPSSYDTCYCMSFAPTNTYWAFYTEPHGKQWQYSAVGFQDPHSALHDGDMQAWRWGTGGANSAPPPAAISFEEVCGHVPQGGANLQTTLTPTTTNVPLPRAQGTPATDPIPTASETTAASVTVAPGAPAAAGTTESATVEVRNHGTATAIPEAPATGGSGAGGSSPAAIIAFAVAALTLLVAIGGALAWRRRRGV